MIYGAKAEVMHDAKYSQGNVEKYMKPCLKRKFGRDLVATHLLSPSQLYCPKAGVEFDLKVIICSFRGSRCLSFLVHSTRGALSEPGILEPAIFPRSLGALHSLVSYHHHHVFPLSSIETESPRYVLCALKGLWGD